MGRGIQVSPVEVISLAQEMRRMNEECMVSIKADISARDVQNEHMTTMKDRRRARIYDHIFAQIGRAGLTELLSSFTDSYNLRETNRNTLNKARHLESSIPSSMTDKFVSRLNQSRGTPVARDDTRWFVGGDQWGEGLFSNRTTLRNRYRNVENMIEMVREGIQHHIDMLQSFKKSGGTQRHTMASTGTASRAFLSRLDYVSDYAVEALVGLGKRAGEPDGIVAAVGNVLDVTERNIEIAHAKGAELADQAETFANDILRADQFGRTGFVTGPTGQFDLELRISQIELAIYRPCLLADGEGLESARSDQRDERYETLRGVLKTNMFEVADFVARPNNHFVPSMIFVCEQALEAINTWETFIKRSVTFETRQSFSEAMAALEHPQQARSGVSRPWGHERGSQGMLEDYLPPEMCSAITTAKATIETWKGAFETTMSRADTLATAIDSGTPNDLSDRVLLGIYADPAFNLLQSVGTSMKEKLENQARIYNQFAGLILRNMTGGGVRGCTEALGEGARYFRAVAQTIETDFFRGSFEGDVDRTNNFEVRRHNPNVMQALQETFGLTPEQIAFAGELGYTPEELIALFRSFETEADAAFFSYLLGGTVESFGEAFRTEPFDLSPEMTILMADFAGRLFETNPEAFVDFNNAILGAYTMCLRTGQWNRDIFLERMFIGSSTIAESYAFLIAVGEDISQSQLDMKIALSGLWTTQIIVINELSLVHSPVGPHRNPLNMSIRDIQPVDSNIFFYLDYTCQVNFDQRTLNAGSNFLSTGLRVENTLVEAELQRLRRAQENFVQNLITNVALGGGILVLGVVAPKVAIFASVGLMAVQGQAGTVQGLNSLPGNVNVWRGTNFVGTQAINAFIAWQNLQSALSSAERQEFMRWFGSGARGEFAWEHPFRGNVHFNELTFTGLYNPNAIELALRLESEGLAGILGMNNDEVNDIRNGINLPSTLPEAERERILADVDLILTGGFPILSEENFEAERFISAINRIDSVTGGGAILGRWEEILGGQVDEN